jgi:hypothetical protein
MPISSDISDIQDRLRAARIPLSRLLSAAAVDRSTWSRWRADKVSPTLLNWRAVQDAADRLAPTNGRCIPPPDNTAAHAGGSSQHPIPDTAESPPLGADHERSAEPVARDSNEFSSDQPSLAPHGADPVS